MKEPGVRSETAQVNDIEMYYDLPASGNACPDSSGSEWEGFADGRTIVRAFRPNPETRWPANDCPSTIEEGLGQTESNQVERPKRRTSLRRLNDAAPEARAGRRRLVGETSCNSRVRLASSSSVPSTGPPSRIQSSSPPIISLTRKPRAASLSAPLVEPLHPAPQQYVTITFSLGKCAVVAAFIVRLGRLIAPAIRLASKSSALRVSITMKSEHPRSMSVLTSQTSVSTRSFEAKCSCASSGSAAGVSSTNEKCGSFMPAIMAQQIGAAQEPPFALIMEPLV